MKQPSPILSRPRPYGQIPVYKIDSDARELTQTELNKYKHLIPRDSQRQNSSSRGEGISSQGRGSSTRNRSSNNQVITEKSMEKNS